MSRGRRALPPLSEREVTSRGRLGWREAPGIWGRKLRHQKGFISTTADLPNVNCHLTRRPTAAVPPGSRGRSGVEREFNQGFSSYKRPSAPAGEPRRQTQAKKKGPRNRDRLFVLKTEGRPSANRERKMGQKGGAGSRPERSSSSPSKVTDMLQQTGEPIPLWLINRFGFCSPNLRVGDQ